MTDTQDEKPLNAIFCTNQMRKMENGKMMPAIFPAGAEQYDLNVGWRLLEVTARIGLPLFYGPIPERESAPPHYILDTKDGGVDIPDNPVISILSSKWLSAESRIINEAFFSMGRPSAMVVRADGKDLDIVQMATLLIFVTQKLKTASKTFNAEVTPEKFVEFWNAHSWPGEGGAKECPVTLGCKACGKEARLRCGKCGVVKYCDAVCQKTDWSAHKKVCSNSWGLLGGSKVKRRAS